MKKIILSITLLTSMLLANDVYKNVQVVTV